MAKRCLVCWSKAAGNSILIADDFEGCFCQDCYRRHTDGINEFLNLFPAFCEAETDDEATELFEQIADCTEAIGLCDDGNDLLYSYLNDKMTEVQSAIDNDVHETKSAEQQVVENARRRDYIAHRHEILRNFIAVTSNNIEGYKITGYHGIVTGTSVLGTGLFSSASAGWADFRGKESSSFNTKMEQAKNAAMDYAIENAIIAGGNAMIAVDIDYSMFASNMIAAVVNGTAVTIEKV